MREDLEGIYFTGRYVNQKPKYKENLYHAAGRKSRRLYIICLVLSVCADNTFFVPDFLLKSEHTFGIIHLQKR